MPTPGFEFTRYFEMHDKTASLLFVAILFATLWFLWLVTWVIGILQCYHVSTVRQKQSLDDHRSLKSRLFHRLAALGHVDEASDRNNNSHWNPPCRSIESMTNFIQTSLYLNIPWPRSCIWFQINRLDAFGRRWLRLQSHLQMPPIFVRTVLDDVLKLVCSDQECLGHAGI